VSDEHIPKGSVRRRETPPSKKDMPPEVCDLGLWLRGSVSPKYRCGIHSLPPGRHRQISEHETYGVFI